MSARLDERLAALASAAELAEGRLDSGPVDAAQRVVARAGRRLGLGLETTVIALAGPTGAGKSSLFNALAGAELVSAGRRRPTTSRATAAVWEGADATALLDWLEVPTRHAVADGRGGARGLALIDLPDFDSIEVSHRLEVDRMVELADLLVWVVDPQKYADASLHDRYLTGLSAHRDAMVFVLNQADLLSGEALAACRRDLARILAGDGLDGVPVMAVSARTGAGVEELRGVLERRVRRREAVLARLAADVTAAAAGLGGACAGAPARVSDGDEARLRGALDRAAGVPGVVAAVGSAHRHRGALAAGWPPTRWVRRLRPDPLRRLGIGDHPQADVRTSLPSPGAVERSNVSSAIRFLAANVSEGMPEPWPGRIREAALAREVELSEALDRSVAGTELVARRPRWWTAASLLQWLLLAVAGAGALWLAAYALLGYLQIAGLLAVPELDGVPVPTVMLIMGAVAGIVVGLLARIVNAVGARRRQRRAHRRLDRAVGEVAEEMVLAPVRAELDARDRLCAALERAARG